MKLRASRRKEGSASPKTWKSFPFGQTSKSEILTSALRLIYCNTSPLDRSDAQLASTLREEDDGIEGSWTHRSRRAHVVNGHPDKSVFGIREWFPSFLSTGLSVILACENVYIFISSYSHVLFSDKFIESNDNKHTAACWNNIQISIYNIQWEPSSFSFLFFLS